MTRKRRYLISAAVFVACVCLALGVLAMIPPRSRVMKMNFDRIKIGMPLAQVKAILGESNVIDIWMGEDGSAIIVVLDADHTVSIKRYMPPLERLPDKLRRWLHLPPAD